MLENILSGVKISDQLALVVPALMIIGYALKRTPKIEDWLIIWILLLIGIVASGFTLGFTVNGIANGIIASGAAITTHQAYKQTRYRNGNGVNKPINEENKSTEKTTQIKADEIN